MNQTKSSPMYKWGVVVFYTLFMAIMTFNLILFPANAVETMEFYGVDQMALSTFSSITTIVGLFAGLIFGPMLDRYGNRKVILIAMVIGVILFYIRAFVTTIMPQYVLTFLSAFFVGVGQVSTSKVLDTWFDKKNVAVAFTFTGAGAGLGSVAIWQVGPALGLHGTLLCVAVLYTILTIIWIIFGYNGPINVQKVKPPEGATKRVWTSKTLWFCAIAGSLACGAGLLNNTYTINAWMSKGLDPAGAAMMGTVLNAGLLIGGFVGSWLQAVIKRYNVVNALCMVFGIIGYTINWFLPLGIHTYVIIFVACLIFGGAICANTSRTALIPLTGEFEQEAIGTAAGAMEMIKAVITFLIPITVTAFVGTNFNAVFIILGIFCVLGIIFGTFLTPELGPKGKLQQEADARAISGISEE